MAGATEDDHLGWTVCAEVLMELLGVRFFTYRDTVEKLLESKEFFLQTRLVNHGIKAAPKQRYYC